MDIIKRHNDTRTSSVRKALVDVYEEPKTLHNIPLFCVEDTKIRSNESKIMNLHVSLEIPAEIRDHVSLAVVYGLGIRRQLHSTTEEPVVTVVGDPLRTGDVIRLDIWNCTDETIFIPEGTIVAVVILPNEISISDS